MQMILTMHLNVLLVLILLEAILKRIHQINVVATIQRDFHLCQKTEIINAAAVKFLIRNTQ